MHVLQHGCVCAVQERLSVRGGEQALRLRAACATCRHYRGRRWRGGWGICQHLRDGLELEDIEVSFPPAVVARLSSSIPA